MLAMIDALDYMGAASSSAKTHRHVEQYSALR